MRNQFDQNLSTRRAFISTAATAVATVAISPARAAVGGITKSHLASAPMSKLRQINAGELSVAYGDFGPKHGEVALLLHGWPYDIHAFEQVVPVLVGSGFRVIVPYLRGFGSTVFRSSSTQRNAQQAVFAVDAIALMDALGVQRAHLAGFDWGARTADIVAALWPERCRSLVSVSGYLIGSQAGNAAPLPPMAELQWWYQFYFATHRGEAGYARNTKEFNRLIWKLASPQWAFEDETFAATANSFANPDHVAIVIHNYRWRLGLVEGERRFDALESRLAASPSIAVPTITMEGDANGAPHPEPASYRHRFTSRYEHRLIAGGVGHNLPQEAPLEFAKAILDAARASR